MENGNLKERAVCVCRNKDKKIIRAEGDTPKDFLPMVKDSTLAWVNFVVDDIHSYGDGIATAFGFSPNLVNSLLVGYRSGYEDRETELGIMIPAVSTEEMEVTVHPLIILIRKGLILSLHDRTITRLVRFSRYAETAIKKIDPKLPWEDKQTIMLWRIIDENNSKNFDHLREIEEQADDLVKSLMDPTTPRDKLGPQIYKMKHALIEYLDSLWATLEVLNTLRYGDAEVLTNDKELLDRASVLAAAVTNQISISEHMSEVLASGLEVLQSIYNNQLQILNNRLSQLVAWLTVLGTAVLVPNTLGTIYGIPSVSEHLNWPFISSTLIISTILSAWVAYMVVRAKLPKTVN